MGESMGTSSLLTKIGEYEEELSKNPSSQIFVQLAEAYRKMGLLEEASAAIEKGLEHHSDLPMAYVAQGRIRAQQGDNEGAVFAFEQVLQRDAQNIYGLKGLARVRLMQNAASMAIPLVKQLLQLRPDDPEVKKLKASCEAQVSTEKQDSEKGKGAPIKTATMVDIYIKQGLFDDALTLCREILADDPGNDTIKHKIETITALKEQATGSSPDGKVANDSSVTETTIEKQPVGKSVVDILESWLSVIQKRRKHV